MPTPTLLLVGGDSPDFVKSGAAVVDATLPNSWIVVMLGQQHVAMYTAPDLFLHEDVVWSRVLLARIEDWEAVIKVRAEFFADIRPVDTITQVARFLNSEWLVEFEVDAVISDGKEPVVIRSK